MSNVSPNPVSAPAAPAAPPVNRAAVIAAMLVTDLLVLDRVLKWVALRTEPRAPRWIVDFVFYKNTGAAFGTVVPPTLYWPLAIAAALAVAVLFSRALRTDWCRAIALYAVLLGAVSNLADRLAYGWVIDYLALLRVGFWNVADFMIVGGLLAVLVFERKK